MKATITCPCCSTALLHHFGNHREYWFCRHCWSEMPDLEIAKHHRYAKLTPMVNLSTKFPSLDYA
ncbi:MAG: hypothetical protein ACRC1Z_22885 [Waterburya sp.]